MPLKLICIEYWEIFDRILNIYLHEGTLKPQNLSIVSG